ncbi:hypothetical protein [Streptomyces sp. V3I7]|uniref:hypothetical protein n=1 Tax=Streptomyces sp. V3I7 TaxID=3042278 RepID=UPI0027D7F7FB|nr:hypothetical protein [Streptomyces sp. V3I7]
MTHPAPPAAEPVAWDTPGTRAAWCRVMAWGLFKCLLWAFCLVGGLDVIVTILPAWAVFTALLLPVFMYCFLGAAFKLINIRTMYLIMINYPWRKAPDGLRVKGRGCFMSAVFVLPDPDNPNKTASPKEPGNFFKRWDRMARKGYKGAVWYVGDPRFAVVVARPGMRDLGYACQPTAFNRKTSPRSKGLSPESRARAIAIGARVGPPRGGSSQPVK